LRYYALRGERAKISRWPSLPAGRASSAVLRPTRAGAKGPNSRWARRKQSTNIYVRGQIFTPFDGGFLRLAKGERDENMCWALLPAVSGQTVRNLHGGAARQNQLIDFGEGCRERGRSGVRNFPRLSR